jgi:murein DD-endopeptidase MepM/ murein hydrolase activator NlpD
MLGSRSSLARPSRALFRRAIVATAVFVANGVVVPPARAATVDSDRAQIAQIQRQIEQKGAEIEGLVEKANEARANLDALHVQIRRDERSLASDDRAEQEARTLVRKAAVVAYIGRSGSGSELSILQSASSITRAMGGQHYLNSVNSHWDDSITKLQLAKARTDDDRRKLLTQQDDAQRVLDQLTRAQAEANAAITAENAALARVRSDLTSLLITQQHQKQAQARRAAERAIAAALAAATQEQDAAPTDPPRGRAPRLDPPTIESLPPKPVTGNGYANPLRSVVGLSAQRIDSGVDYAGSGPVYAIGNGVVLNVYAADWPGGTFIAYQLSDGPASGLVVYTAEDLNPQVSVGSTVTANTVIGQMYGGPHGIEIGWADGSRIPDAMARSYGQYHGNNSTAFGHNFSRFLQALGAPGGILNNNPTGTLPAGWPQW